MSKVRIIAGDAGLIRDTFCRARLRCVLALSLFRFLCHMCLLPARKWRNESGCEGMALLMEHNDGASALLLITCRLSSIQSVRVRVLARSLSRLLFLHLLRVYTSLLVSDIKQTLIHLFSPQHLTPRFIFVHLMSNATDQQQFFGFTVLN